MLKEAQQHSERVMGVRHGGPMAPSRPDSYASALGAQVKAREVLRAEEPCGPVVVCCCSQVTIPPFLMDC